MQKLCKQLRIAKHLYLDQPGGVLSSSSGGSTKQRSQRGSSGKSVDKDEAVSKSNKEIELLNEGQHQVVNTVTSVTAEILWLARQGRPDVVGAADFFTEFMQDGPTMAMCKFDLR
eukprot:2626205-Amphidinium_carterae.3